ncbi:MAG: SDR family NAD(P)-dependent oxidoreductase [Bacteroidota bacterium]
MLFAENGARVAITGRNKASLAHAVKEIGHEAIALTADVSDVNSITRSYQEIHEKLGKIGRPDHQCRNRHFRAIDKPTRREDFDKVSNTNF